MSTTTAAAPPTHAGFSWGHRARQVGAVIRLELKKGFLGRRSIWLYLLAAAPLAPLVARWLFDSGARGSADLESATAWLSGTLQGFFLPVVLFFSCAGVFGNLVRREVLDRSLHYYFLSPLRRDLFVLAKYLTGLIVTLSIFSGSVLACFAMAYLPHDSHAVQQFLFHGPGMAHLAKYLLVTALGCVGYGAVFLAFGFFFKSPIIPGLAMFGWERINPLLPPLLKKMSVIHYLKGLCPVPLPQAPIGYLADAPPPWLSIVGLLVFAGLLVYISTFKVKRMEISYEES